MIMSHRTIKQLIYGFFYFSFVAAIFVGIYFMFLKPTPSCFDGKKNQNEAGIDCGGVCAPCELATLSPIQVSWTNILPGVPGRASIIMKLVNPNTNFGASVLPYHLLVLGPFGGKLEERSGETFIYAGEIKYLSETINQDFRDISGATMTLGNPQWVKGEEFPSPKLQSRAIKTEIIASSAEISGIIKNNEAVSIPRAKVIALLFDRTDRLVTVSQTVLTDIGGLEERSFSMTLALDSFIVKEIVLAKTKLFIESRFPSY